MPKIVRELNRLGVAFRLRIAGKGKHQSIIEQKMRAEIERGQVEFMGALPPNEVPMFLAETDVFIFTSHFEGCPNALLEAAMAGCVPVSWCIEGITDFIIEDEKSGFICPMGEIEFFARRIARLDNDRARLQEMSKTVVQVARKRFTHERAAKAYANLFKKVMSESPPEWKPKPWEDFHPDLNFKHSWKEIIPVKIRNWLN